MWQQENVEKRLPIVFGSKTYIWTKKYNSVVIAFNFDFEGEMNYLIPLCMKDNVLERVVKKSLAKFSTSCKLQMSKHCCFPFFFEVKSFSPLNFDVIFRSNLSPCTNVFNPTLLLLGGWVLNACICINTLVQN
jgi:hypothetical protein